MDLLNSDAGDCTLAGLKALHALLAMAPALVAASAPGAGGRATLGESWGERGRGQSILRCHGPKLPKVFMAVSLVLVGGVG